MEKSNKAKTVNELNKSWVWNKAEDPDNNVVWERYDCITCCIIEMSYEQYLKDSSHYQFTIGGGWSIDLKEMV